MAQAMQYEKHLPFKVNFIKRLEGGVEVDVGHFDRVMILDEDRGCNATPENHLRCLAVGTLRLRHEKPLNRGRRPKNTT